MANRSSRARESYKSRLLGRYLDADCFDVLCRGIARPLVDFAMGIYWLAVALITINLIGDFINVFLGTETRAIVGVHVAAAILLIW